MNHLVAYDEESDEDSPRNNEAQRNPLENVFNISPRARKDSDVYDDSEAFADYDGRKSTSPRSDGSNTMDFAEPPPPKRPKDTPSPSENIALGMARISSTASLVSYGGEDGFDQAEREGADIDKDRDSPDSGMAEPRPPERKSQDCESDDENERIIDEALESAQLALKERQGGSEGSVTPINECDSPRTPDVEERDEDNQTSEIPFPPSPEGEVDSHLQRKLEIFFQKKAQGIDLNFELQNKREFLNPSCYETFIERFNLDEKGSNFSSNIFDPHGFPENCFFDKLNEEQRKIIDAKEKESKKSAPSHRK